MILTKNIDRFIEFYPEILEMKDFLSKISTEKLGNGQYTITKYLTANVFDYQTELNKTNMYEAHKEHIDIHCLLEGEERVEIASYTEKDIISYDETIDGLTINCLSSNQIHLQPTQYLFLYPEEAHRTGLSINRDSYVRKVVFKLQDEGRV